MVIDPATQSVSGSAVDKMFYWFFSGTMFGAFFAWLMYEGEYALGVYKTASKIEKEILDKVKLDLQYSKKNKKPTKKQSKK